MQTLKVTVNDDRTKQILISMLKTIDGVQVQENKQVEHRNAENALIELCGIWKGRDASIIDIRKKAWERTVK